MCGVMSKLHLEREKDERCPPQIMKDARSGVSPDAITQEERGAEFKS